MALSRWFIPPVVCALLSVLSLPPGVHAASAHGAKVSTCAAPCVATFTGFGNMKWPNTRTDLVFSAPAQFTVSYTFGQCYKSGFMLRIHNGSGVLTVASGTASSGKGSRAINRAAASLWQPEVRSHCAWSFRVLSASGASGTSPSTFKLPAADFPPGSVVQKSQVETNAALAAGDVALPHFGTASFEAEGRTTGYYMQALQGNNGHSVATYYLVSLFKDTASATAAFAQQQAGWTALVGAPGSTAGADAVPPGLGDHSARYHGSSSTSEGTVDLSELFFVRGPVLVEVGQAYFDADANPYGATASPYVAQIAARLDALVRAHVGP